jgi:hypothetical protein
MVSRCYEAVEVDLYVDDNLEAVIAVLGWPAAPGGAESCVKYAKATLFQQ